MDSKGPESLSADRVERAAPVVAAAPVEPLETQPTEFPVDFEEWAGRKPLRKRVLLAGFRAATRKEGKLLKKQSAAAWEAAFQAFGARTRVLGGPKR